MNGSLLGNARMALLDPAGVDETDLALWLANLCGHSGDFAELYFQSHKAEKWSLKDSRAGGGRFEIRQGVAIRVLRGNTSYSATVEGLHKNALKRAIMDLRSGSGPGRSPVFSGTTPMLVPVCEPEDPTDAFEAKIKRDFLVAVDRYTRGRDPRVSQVSIDLACNHDTVLVAASDGTLAADIRPLVELRISVHMGESGASGFGKAGGGGRWPLSALLARSCWSEFADQALRIACLNLEAEPAPTGRMPVVLGPGWPGILLHEAVGHGLEADVHRKQTSAYCGRLGDIVASEQCTVVDDGTLPGRRGSFSVDDEGTPSARNVLIDRGRLVGVMHDKVTAKAAGAAPSGNARRESFSHPPMPRMTTTFMLPGPYDPGEIVAAVNDGIYAAAFDQGHADVVSGDFDFSAIEAYRIRGGRIAEPLRGLSLSGNGPTVLRDIRMVGQDLRLDPGLGLCGKEGQTVPVGVGQPTILVGEMLVGGIINGGNS